MVLLSLNSFLCLLVPDISIVCGIVAGVVLCVVLLSVGLKKELGKIVISQRHHASETSGRIEICSRSEDIHRRRIEATEGESNNSFDQNLYEMPETQPKCYINCTHKPTLSEWVSIP
jgi:hypothetical protein